MFNLAIRGKVFLGKTKPQIAPILFIQHQQHNGQSVPFYIAR